MAPEDSSRRPRVLVIDDDVFIGRALVRSLHDCDVIYEQDGLAAAQRFADREPFDLILCDLHMPTVTAADVLDAARTVNPELAERIVVITGGTTCDDDERLLRATGARVVYKPFDRSELDDLVRWARERPAT